MAGKYSADDNSASQGGDMGEIALENLPPEFQNAISLKQAGQTAEPFESQYGVHIVRLDEHQEEKKLTLSDDWSTLEMYALSSKREGEFRNWVEKLKQDHYIYP